MFGSRSWRGVLDTALCDSQWLATSRWFSLFTRYDWNILECGVMHNNPLPHNLQLVECGQYVVELKQVGQWWHLDGFVNGCFEDEGHQQSLLSNLIMYCLCCLQCLNVRTQIPYRPCDMYHLRTLILQRYTLAWKASFSFYKYTCKFPWGTTIKPSDVVVVKIKCKSTWHEHSYRHCHKKENFVYIIDIGKTRLTYRTYEVMQMFSASE